LATITKRSQLWDQTKEESENWTKSNFDLRIRCTNEKRIEDRKENIEEGGRWRWNYGSCFLYTRWIEINKTGCGTPEDLSGLDWAPNKQIRPIVSPKFSGQKFLNYLRKTRFLSKKRKKKVKQHKFNGYLKSHQKNIIYI